MTASAHAVEDESYHDDFESEGAKDEDTTSKTNMSFDDDDARSADKENLDSSQRSAHLHDPAIVEDDDDDAQQRHFRVSVELHSIKELNVTASVYLKYSYPAFGPNAVFRTQPPVNIRKNVESILPHSFCAFEFAMTRSRLYASLASVPLAIEICHRDKYKKDVILGHGHLNMADILRAPIIKTEKGGVRVQDAYIALCEFKGDKVARRIGLLRTIVYLEDLGSLPNIPSHTSTTHTPTHTTTGQPLSVSSSPPHHGTVSASLGPAARTTEHINIPTSYSLETRTVPTAVPVDQLTTSPFPDSVEKVLSRLLQAEENFKMRERQREEAVQRHMAEYNQLESRLRQRLMEVQRRETKVVDLEDELKRKLIDTDRQLKLKDEECAIIQRRLKEENAVIQRRLKEEAELAQRRLRDELGVNKEKDQREKLELEKQAELNAKDLLILELNKKIDSAVRSRDFYKSQLDKVVSEMNQAKRAFQSERDTWIRREQAEADRLRVQLIAKTESESLREEKYQLDAIKKQLEELSAKASQPVVVSPSPFIPSVQPDSVSPIAPLPYPNRDIVPLEAGTMESHRHLSASTTLPNRAQSSNPPVKDELTRLVSERTSLLASGYYSEKDRIILELDTQIRTLRAGKR